MIDWGSTWRGIRAMRRPRGCHTAKWSVRWVHPLLHRGWWCESWTPAWHDGRGPYVSIGLWFVAIYRGY